MYKMSKTYEVVTNNGAISDGFEYDGKEFDSLEELAREIKEQGGVTCNSWGTSTRSEWYYTVSPYNNYEKEETTYYTYYPRNLTEEEARQLGELLK